MLTAGDVFRVQCTFPNVESEAVLNEKSNNIGKKSGKNRGMVLTVGNDIGGSCFQGPVCISKYGKIYVFR